jgi:hypothetical protein
MGVATLASKNSCVKDLFPKDKVLFLNPQVGILAPFAPMSFGPDGAAEDEQGKMLSVASESTKNDNLLWLSFKNNNPEPCEKDIAVAVFISPVSSRCGVCFIGRAHRFPASGKEKCICKIYAGICCDTVKWGNIVFGFNIVTSLSKCLSGDISRSNEFISLV